MLLVPQCPPSYPCPQPPVCNLASRQAHFDLLQALQDKVEVKWITHKLIPSSVWWRIIYSMREQLHSIVWQWRRDVEGYTQDRQWGAMWITKNAGPKASFKARTKYNLDTATTPSFVLHTRQKEEQLSLIMHPLHVARPHVAPARANTQRAAHQGSF